MKIHKSERKLATIRKIAEIKPIEGADQIEAVRVDGWWVVAKKGEYSVGSLATYLEVDSFVPNSIAPFLTKAGHEPKRFENIVGERLRTIRLRGQLSQGLLLPISEDTRKGAGILLEEGLDLTDHLGILKWEKPMSAQLAGMAKGNFPSFIPKTDQERIQNCTRSFQEYQEKHLWSVTEKLDGSSMTIYVNHNEFDEEGAPKYGVCSRNLDLKFDESNSFWEAAIKYQLLEKIKSTGRSLAIQGELVGEGIQGNSYKLFGREFFCFDIWDIDTQKYLLPSEMFKLCKELDIQTVPELESKHVLLVDISGLIQNADGKSLVGSKPKREGLVYKSNAKHDFSFKVISNSWLLAGGE